MVTALLEERPGIGKWTISGPVGISLGDWLALALLGEKSFLTGLLRWQQDAWSCQTQACHHMESASGHPATYGKGL